MSPKKKSNSNILNNLNEHVDAGDVLFVVSGDVANNQQTIEAITKKCKSRCPGHKKLNRNLHSKIIDASQFLATCGEAHCSGLVKTEMNDDLSIKNKTSGLVTEQFSDNNIEKAAGKLVEKKRLDGYIRNRIKARGPPQPVNSKWKREVIQRQLKNHRVSSTSMDKGSRPHLMIRPAEKLKVLQDIFDSFVTRKKWDSVSENSENLSGIMNRIGLSKYGFKIADKSPYATNEVKKTKRRSRSVIDIVPRHNCFESEDTRVPSYMGWYWTKCFSEIANTGWRPGAIPRNIRDIMSYFNGPCSCMPNDLPTCVTYKNNLAVEKSTEQVVAIKPTLRVVRRDGLYYVCMNPLKSSEELAQSQNPYLDDCPPIKFQIALNRQRGRQEDDDLGLLGYPCSERPAICEENKEMQDLLNLLAEECENDKEFYKLAKTLCSKPSDLDIEFIAPGANVIDNSNYKEGMYKETQYDKSDFEDGQLLTRSLSTLSTKRKQKSAV